jgi:hypothetical protein
LCEYEASLGSGALSFKYRTVKGGGLTVHLQVSGR